MNKTKIDSCSDYDLGWIAGIIDGEGSIGLMRSKRKTYKAGYTYAPRLSVGNSEIEMLTKLKEILGGSLSKASAKFREDIGHKPFWNWSISAGAMREVLPAIKLVTKEKQRKLILEALAVLGKHVGKNTCRSQRDTDHLHLIHRQIRELNGRVWNKS
jgi:hypothetical protein